MADHYRKWVVFSTLKSQVAEDVGYKRDVVQTVELMNSCAMYIVTVQAK